MPIYVVYYAMPSKVGSHPNIHEIPDAGITIAQTLPELQGYALHVPDQVNFQERTTLPYHTSTSENISYLSLNTKEIICVNL